MSVSTITPEEKARYPRPEETTRTTEVTRPASAGLLFYHNRHERAEVRG